MKEGSDGSALGYERLVFYRGTNGILKHEALASGRSALLLGIPGHCHSSGARGETDPVTLSSGLRTGATIPAVVGGRRAGLRPGCCDCSRKTHWWMSLDHTGSHWLDGDPLPGLWPAVVGEFLITNLQL